MMREYDVVIVGAGPVGLSLALNLGERKKKVLVLEKDPQLHEYSRAPAIWPRTQEILNDLDVMDEVQRQGIIHKKLQMIDSDSGKENILLEIPLEELKQETKFAQLVILPQEKTEKILLEKIKNNFKNVEVQFSSEFKSLSQNKDSVTVDYTAKGEEQKVTANFLVGCDGAHSAVREALGFHLDGITYSMSAALADISLPENKQFGSPRITSKTHLAVGIKIESNLWRIILPYPKDSTLPLEDRLGDVVSSMFSDSEYKLHWKSEFKLHQRVSQKFQEGRVVLAGDAAHLNSPVGGQGMNAGIQDSAKLAVALIQDMENKSTKSIAGYASDRRKEIVLGVNDFTDTLTKTLLLFKGKPIKVVLKLINLAFHLKSFRTKIMKKIAMLN